MPRPPLSTRSHTVQSAAAISLEIVHDLFRPIRRVNPDVHVIRANVRGDHAPLAMTRDFENRFQYNGALSVIQHLRRMLHRSLLSCLAESFLIEQRRSRHVVFPVDRTGPIAVQVSTITSEGDEVGHLVAEFNTRPLAHARGSEAANRAAGSSRLNRYLRLGPR